MSNTKSVLGFSKIFLDLLFWVAFLLIGMLLWFGFMYKNNSSSELILYLWVVTFYGVLSLFILFQLRKIVKSVLCKNPFTKENVKRFKNIGKGMIFISVFNLFFNNHTGLRFVDLGFLTITPELLVFILLALVALILSEVFEEAIKIKNENDFTI